MNGLQSATCSCSSVKSRRILIVGSFADDKNKLEAQNHELVLAFGCQLDKSLIELHKTIFGSVSLQQDQLRCMEEHMCSFLARKDDVRILLR